jgi:uncharacterized protein YeaO (DUF488 family)
MITLKRAYEAEGCFGAKCFLVERLWPRGIKKEYLPVNGWMQDVAPSHQLRRWFRHDPVKWDEFKHRYFAELDAKPDAWKPLAEAARHDNIIWSIALMILCITTQLRSNSTLRTRWRS